MVGLGDEVVGERIEGYKQAQIAKVTSQDQLKLSGMEYTLCALADKLRRSMEFEEVVLRRRMVRNYATDPVEPEAVDRILRNALHAPSAGFTQGWAFLRLDSADDVRRFWQASTPPGGGTDVWSEGMRRAPVVVVPMSNKQAYLDRYAEPDKGWSDRDESRWPAPYWDIDVGMAAMLMLLTATDEGLGACFFGIPPTRIAAFRDEFGVPDDFSPIGAITIGHRAPDRRSPSLKRGRRELPDVVHHGRWTTH